MTTEAAERDETVRLLRESAAGFAPRSASLKRARALRFTSPGFERPTLERMAELGWIGLLLPEEFGGVGLGMAEFCALCEELGASLVPEPLIASVLSATLLAQAGDEARLEQVLAGRHMVLTAWQEQADTLDAPGSLQGTRVYVAGAAGADEFLLPVRRNGELSLVSIAREEANLTLLQTQDGGEYGTLSLPPDAARAKALPLRQCDFALALDRAALATAAYLLGVAEASFALTLGYLKERKQFGKPIGSFQVLQHRATDLHMQLALARASIDSAAATLDGVAPAAAGAAAVSRAKARASDVALLVTRQSVQMHGAIGFTDEYDAGLYMRKAMVLASLFGSARFHRRRFMSTLPADDDE